MRVSRKNRESIALLAQRLDGKYTENELCRMADPIGWECLLDDLDVYDNFRVCSICGSLMHQGYCFDQGHAYYCSDECLHHDFTDEEWLEEYNTNDQSYWTAWYEP